MAIKALSPDFAVSPQSSPADVRMTADQRYRSIISCRSGARPATLRAMLETRSSDAVVVLRTTAVAGYCLSYLKAKLASERHGTTRHKACDAVNVLATPQGRAVEADCGGYGPLTVARSKIGQAT